jgi:hypothetical protein
MNFSENHEYVIKPSFDKDLTGEVSVCATHSCGHPEKG